MFAVGEEGGPVRQFVSAIDATEALTHTQDGEIAVAFQGPIKTGGLIQQGAVTFPAPTAAVLTAQAWLAVRQQRNALLDEWRWTFALDSELTSDCQALWLAWARTLNRLTIDYSTPQAVVWPNMPALAYSPLDSTSVAPAS